MRAIKEQLYQSIIGDTRLALETMEKAVKAAKSVSSGHESKQEGKYDTRAIEAGYLAGAQSARVKQLEKQIVVLEQMLKSLALERPSYVALGSLVCLESEEGQRWFFLAPVEGGKTYQIENIDYKILSPQSPLGKNLIGLSEGEVVVLDWKEPIQELELLMVR
jgi:transcription elongation GreA/GreB family factor